ncbi:hypothetical protein ACFV0R_02905 [Streptomyces sp. NPDC059578]|uniref:hypothetical protein n=1 Tax=Streptomyces sp. NPDC059578 TaxID=3346874 RepID=UPI0036CEDF26
MGVRSDGRRRTLAFAVAAAVLSTAGWGATEFLNSTAPGTSPPEPYASQDPTGCAADPAGLCAHPREATCAEVVAELGAHDRERATRRPTPGLLSAESYAVPERCLQQVEDYRNSSRPRP